MNSIITVPYKESRLEHFKAVREKRKKTLHWWKCQKPYKQYDAQTIQDKRLELWREIGYLDGVIELLSLSLYCESVMADSADCFLPLPKLPEVEK